MNHRPLFLAAVVAALWLAGSVYAQSAPVENPPAPPAPNLLEQLAAEIGQGHPVAVLAGKDGLYAVSMDGARRKTLVQGPVYWVEVDNRAQVVWFGQSAAKTATVSLFDLQATAVQPEVICTGLPVNEPVSICYAMGKESKCLNTGLSQSAQAFVTIDAKTVSIGAMAGLLDVVDPDMAKKHDRAVKKARLAKNAKERLLTLTRRSVDRTVSGAVPPAADLERLASISEQGCEEDPSYCGQANRVPGTPYWVVVFGYSCGDGCYTMTQLYDPRTAEFLDLANPTRRAKQPITSAEEFHQAWVAPDGQAILMGSTIFSLSTGKTASSDGRGGGWIGGGWFVD